MEQPKKIKYVSAETAGKKRDSLDYEAVIKKQSAMQSNDWDRSQELMKRASHDYDQARKWDESIKKGKKN